MEYVFSDRITPITGSAIRAIFALLADPNIVSLAGGNPSPKTFPSEDMARISADLISKHGDKLLQYGATEGFAPLRETAADRNSKLGIGGAVENILPVTGSSQGIELVCKVFLNAGDTILVENPTFLGAVQTMRSYRANVVGVDMEDDGVDLVDLEAKIKQYKPKVFYIIPTFQNPSGRTTSEKKRQAVLELAKQYDFIIMEDDPYGELRYNGTPIAPIKSMDDDGRVVHLSSFSKTISPGLRVGYATADPKIIRKMVIGKQGMDVHTPNLSQALVDAFYREGKYYDHVKKCCDFYKPQLDAMIKGMKEHFPADAQYPIPEGGLFAWVKIPGINGIELFNTAVENGVAFVPGEHFYADLSGTDTFRLNFSLPSVSQIEWACDKLGKIIVEMMNK